MGVKKWLRLALCGVFAACISLASATVWAAQSFVWAASGDSLIQIDVTSGATIRTVPLSGVRQLSADDSGAVWALTNLDLRKYESNGANSVLLNFSELGVSAPVIAVYGYDNSVWVIDDNRSLRLSATGSVIASSAQAINSLRYAATNVAESAWLLGNKRLVKLSPAAQQLGYWDIQDQGLTATDLISADEIHSVLWVTGEKLATRLDSRSPTGARTYFDLPETAVDVASSAELGAAWILTQSKLIRLSWNAATASSLDLAAVNISRPTSVAFDPVSRTVWAAHGGGLTQLTPEGTVVRQVQLAIGAREVATRPFVVKPVLALVSPAPGSRLRNATPVLQLTYSLECSATPCAVVPTQRPLITATLNGISIGTQFQADPSFSNLTYTAGTALPEGTSTLDAQVVDAFGHLSNRVTSSFVVDTIPPSFLSISPANGTVVTVPTVTLTGALSEPGTVVLENAAALGSQISTAGASFQFPLVLLPGINTAHLVATDLAGNVSRQDVTVTYQRSGLTLTIDTPSSGTTVSRSSVLVSGTVLGADSIGVTVNGRPARVDNGLFDATVTLNSGANTIVARASAPGVSSVTQELTINVAPTGPDVNVYPRYGLAPHTVYFSVSVPRGDTFDHATVELMDGTGTTVTIGPGKESVLATYSNAGIFNPRVTVFGSGSGTTVVTDRVVVESAQTVDARLRVIYRSMVSRLRAGDIEGALLFFTEDSRTVYRPVFLEISNRLPELADALSNIVDGTLDDDHAEYVVGYSKPDGVQLFYIYLIRGADGVWRFDSM